MILKETSLEHMIQVWKLFEFTGRISSILIPYQPQRFPGKREHGLLCPCAFVSIFTYETLGSEGFQSRWIGDTRNKSIKNNCLKFPSLESEEQKSLSARKKNKGLI